MLKTLAIIMALILAACGNSNNSLLPFNGAIGDPLTAILNSDGIPSEINARDSSILFIYDNIRWQGQTGDLIFNAGADGMVEFIAFTITSGDKTELLNHLSSIFTEIEAISFAMEFITTNIEAMNAERQFYLEHMPEEEHQMVNDHFDTRIENTQNQIASIREQVASGNFAIFSHQNYLVQFSDLSTPFDPVNFQLLFYTRD
ncbi:MAG: hypothetical protein FWE37_02770 [Spirochaetaceae bacterium]|nr:hypothetical protein [Spirochaetaceae bacterium]